MTFPIVYYESLQKSMFSLFFNKILYFIRYAVKKSAAKNGVFFGTPFGWPHESVVYSGVIPVLFSCPVGFCRAVDK